MSDLELEVVAQGGFGLCEAPVVEPDGTAWFSDVTGGGIFRLAPGAGAIEEVLAGRRGVGGLVRHERGGVVASGRDLVHVRPDGTTAEVWAPDEELGLKGLNDLAVDQHGWVVAGALRFAPMAGEAPEPGWVVIAAERFIAVAADEGVTWPNGIGFSPDGRHAYVCDYADGRVLRAEVDRQGAVGEDLRPWASVGDGAAASADGLAVDAEGGVWVATGQGGGLVRLGPDGEATARVDGLAPFVSSIAFGGRDGRDVLVTTAGGPEGGTVLRGRSAVAGHPLRACTLGTGGGRR